MKKDWNKTFLDIASIISKHSTCIRLQVGCIITKDGKIISQGHNGTPQGHEHCEDYFKDGGWTDGDHKKFSDENELHAEQNAINFAAKNGITTNGADLYTTISPCNSCSKSIIVCGIKKIIYLEEYDRSIKGIELMKKSGIEVIKYES